VRAGQGGIDPADMTCLGIAVGDHGLDAGTRLAKKPKGTGAKEALAILRDAVEQDQPREDPSFGGIGEAGVPSDDRIGRRHRKDGHTFKHRAAAEETDRDLSGRVARQIMMLGDERARRGVVDDVRRVGVRIDDERVGRP